MMIIEKITNGLTLGFRQMPGRKGIKVCVASKMSSRHEKISECGLTHFCEHSLLGGTRNISSSLVKKEIELLGGTLNAYTSQDIVSIEGDFTLADFKKGFKLIGDLFFFPSFPKDFVEQERKVILQEIAEYSDDPWSIVSQEAMNIFYKGRGVGIAAIGSENDVKRFTVRDMKKHWSKVSATLNCVIYILGDIGEKEMNFVRECYSDLPRKPGVVTRKTKSYTGGKEVNKQDKDQVYLSILFDAPPMEDYREVTKAEVLSAILGEGVNSRIWKRVRDKMGAAYDVRTGVVTYRKNGYFEFNAALDPSKWEKAMKAMLAESKKIATKGPSKREVQHAVKGFVRYYTIIQDDPTIVADIDVATLCSGNRQDSFIHKLKTIQEITQSDIQDIAAKIFQSGEPTIQVLGPVDPGYFTQRK